MSFQTLSTEIPPPDSRECEELYPDDVVPDGMKREETGQSTSRHVRAVTLATFVHVFKTYLYTEPASSTRVTVSPGGIRTAPAVLPFLLL